MALFLPSGSSNSVPSLHRLAPLSIFLSCFAAFCMAAAYRKVSAETPARLLLKASSVFPALEEAYLNRLLLALTGTAACLRIESGALGGE
jgi:hypothetical protein